MSITDSVTNRPDYRAVIKDLNLPELLAGVDFEIIGTPPLGIDVAGSDIDIACAFLKPDELAVHICKQLDRHQGLQSRSLSHLPHKTNLVSLLIEAWPIEFFIQNRPLGDQHGVRHFHIEARLLALFGADFKEKIIQLKQSGIKTEPAFAQLLGISGDPYFGLLKLESLPDQELQDLYSSKL